MNGQSGKEGDSHLLLRSRVTLADRPVCTQAGSRRGLYVELVSVSLVVLILLIAGTQGGTHSKMITPTQSQTGVAIATAASESTRNGVVASCTVDAAWSDAYDAANGFIYVASAYGGVFIVKPPCHVMQSILPNALGFGTAYDPVTRDIVVTDQAYVGGHVIAEVIHGSTTTTTVDLGNFFDHCPDFEAWDAAVGSILIADGCPSVGPPSGGGVDVLHLTTTGGTTHASVRLDAFDRNNGPTAVLVADGYVFSAGNIVDVFDARTFHFVGGFAVNGPGNPVGGTNTLGWDPLTQTVILGRGDVSGHGSVVFLNVSSIASGRFTFGYLSVPGILDSGVGGVAYSPSTHNVYLTAYGGNDVWELSSSGELTHVYLGQYAAAQGLAYDPANDDMYVCGFGSSMVYVIR